MLVRHRKIFGFASPLIVATAFLSAATPNPSSSTNPDAMRLLKAAEAGASALGGTDRAYAYWLISRSYAGFDKQSQLETAIKSCEAAVAPEAERADFGLRQKVQVDCLHTVLALQPKAGEGLLGQADPDVRQHIIAEKAAKSASQGNVDAALEMLSEEISRASHYPYSQAMQVIQALPAEDRAARDRVFAQALTYYKIKNNRFDVAVDDLGTMTSKFWRDLSPGLVLEAIDTLLDTARREAAEPSHLEISIVSGNNAAGLSSLYQYRVFQLIPVLRALDPARAEKLAESSTQRTNLLRQFPEASQSFKSSAPAPNVPFTMTLHIKSGPATDDFAAVDDLIQARLQQRAEKIIDEVRDNADQALTDALGLPDSLQRMQSVKADLILRIAAMWQKTNPNKSTQALRELIKAVKNYDPLTQSRYLAQIGDQFLVLKNRDAANDVLHLGLAQIMPLYKLDTNSDDPNQALKSSWPSTVVSRAFVALAGKYSLKHAEEIIQQLPDPDLQVFARIQLASTLLKTPSYPSLMQQKHREAKDSFAAVFPVPGAND